MTIFADEEKENRITKLMRNSVNCQSQCDFMKHYYDFVLLKVKIKANRLECVKSWPINLMNERACQNSNALIT